MENAQMDLADLSSVNEVLKLLKKSEELAKKTFQRVLAAKEAIEDLQPQSSQTLNAGKSQRSVKYLEDDKVIDSTPLYSSTTQAAILDGFPHQKGFQKDHLATSKQLYETILHHCTALKQESASSNHLEKKLAGTSMGKIRPRPTIDIALNRMKNCMDLISFQCECYFDECQLSNLSAKDRRHCQCFHTNVLTRKTQRREKTKERQNVVLNSRRDEDAKMDKFLLDKSVPAEVHEQSATKSSPPLSEQQATLITAEVPRNSATCRQVTRYMSQEFIQESLCARSSCNKKGSDVSADDLPFLDSDSEEFQPCSTSESRRYSPSQKVYSTNSERKEKNREKENPLSRVRPSVSMLALPVINMSALSKQNILISHQPDDIDEEGSDIASESQSVDYSDNAARLKYRAHHPQPHLRDASQYCTDNFRGARMKKTNVEHPVRKSSLRLSAPVLEKWTRLQVKTCIVKSKASQTEPQQ